MASYDELFKIGLDDRLRNRVAVAVLVKAVAISEQVGPTQLEIDWAREAFSNHIALAEPILYAVLAANKGATVDQIKGAPDTAIQANVDSVVENIFTKAGA